MVWKPRKIAWIASALAGILIERQQLQLDRGQMFAGFQDEIAQQLRIARQRIDGRRPRRRRAGGFLFDRRHAAAPSLKRPKHVQLPARSTPC